MTAFELTGKVVLITGGTVGLGSATARTLLSRGARVGIVDLRPDTPEIAARTSSSDVVGFTADVCDRGARSGRVIGREGVPGPARVRVREHAPEIADAPRT